MGKNSVNLLENIQFYLQKINLLFNWNNFYLEKKEIINLKFLENRELTGVKLL